MNKPCKYCGHLRRDDLTADTYSNVIYGKCPAVNARVNINGTCVDDEKRLAYTGKMHFLDIDLGDGK